MRKLTALSAILLSSLILVGCSSSKSEFDGISAQELYNKGQVYLEKGDYTNAVRYLEEVDLREQQGGYAEQIQLSIIYGQYKLGEYYKALDIAERFARSYPNSHSMDYAYYLAGLSNARLSDNWIQDTFRVNPSERAIDNIRNAFGNFQVIIQHYPNSQYVEDAKQWVEYLKNRLAEHELGISKFYLKREAYVAVANRVQEMIRVFPDQRATYEALPLLHKSLVAMNLHESAEKVALLIKQSEDKTFPKIKKPKYGKPF